MQAELSGIFTPVILGANFKSLRLATRLCSMYGVKSLVYDTHHSLLHRVCPYIECHTINYEKDDVLLLDLGRTARLYDTTLLYLFPIRERYRTFVKKKCTALEDKFVIVEDTDKFTPNGAYK